MTGGPYKHVRALDRGIQLLQKLNEFGTAKPSTLAKAAGIDRTTAYRLLSTLESAGLIRQAESSEDYVLTELVRSLSDGFIARDRTTRIVAAQLGVLFPKILWPTDFATFERGVMVIRETTHRFSPYSVHRAMVGKRRPLLTSALGRAALAGAEPGERATMIEIVCGETNASELSDRQVREQADHVVQDFSTRGYGWSAGGSDGKTSAIAVPLRTGGEAAAINMVFFSSAMSIEAAAKRHLEALRRCASDIERDLAAP